jgi:hypothetical protein
MFVAGALRGGNASLQRRSGLFRPSGLGEELAILKITGHVLGMRRQQGLEMLVGGRGVAGIGALHRQAVAAKSVARFGGDEIFEELAARLLLRLGGSHSHSIFTRARNAKSSS